MVLRLRMWVLVLTVVGALTMCACGTTPELPAKTNAGEPGGEVMVTEQNEQTNAEEVSASDDAPSATLRYLGQASLRIVTPEGKVIYIDPYAGTDEDYALPADLILVTHDHFDHCAVERVTNRADGCVVITHNEAVVDGQHPTFDLGFVTVIPVQAGFNRLHSVDKCVGYVLVLSDGTSIYVTGDTSTTDNMRDGTLAAMNLDYAFWCSDGVYNMGSAEAAEAAAMVGAAHNIPYHNSTTDEGERFDRAAAEQFAAPNAMVVYPREDFEL